MCKSMIVGAQHNQITFQIRGPSKDCLCGVSFNDFNGSYLIADTLIFVRQTIPEVFLALCQCLFRNGQSPG